MHFEVLLKPGLHFSFYQKALTNQGFLSDPTIKIHFHLVLFKGVLSLIPQAPLRY